MEYEIQRKSEFERRTANFYDRETKLEKYDRQNPAARRFSSLSLRNVPNWVKMSKRLRQGS